MRKRTNRIFVLLLAAVLTLGTAVGAQAAEGYPPTEAAIPVGGTGVFLLKEAGAPDADAGFSPVSFFDTGGSMLTGYGHEGTFRPVPCSAITTTFSSVHVPSVVTCTITSYRAVLIASVLNTWKA